MNNKIKREWEIVAKYDSDIIEADKVIMSEKWIKLSDVLQALEEINEELYCQKSSEFGDKLLEKIKV